MVTADMHLNRLTNKLVYLSKVNVNVPQQIKSYDCDKYAAAVVKVIVSSIMNGHKKIPLKLINNMKLTQIDLIIIDLHSAKQAFNFCTITAIVTFSNFGAEERVSLV